MKNFPSFFGKRGDQYDVHTSSPSSFHAIPFTWNFKVKEQIEQKGSVLWFVSCNLWCINFIIISERDEKCVSFLYTGRISWTIERKKRERKKGEREKETKNEWKVGRKKTKLIKKERRERKTMNERKRGEREKQRMKEREEREKERKKERKVDRKEK